ncbi:SDR family NAD(P)-dependent oxidoreductase [Francisella tularensis]|nr:SDR family NAD(P)-dependent oxidoreductase [Francisella tularensis]
MSVKNKVTLITGAASGLGLGMETEFAKQGAKVVIADLDIEK